MSFVERSIILCPYLGGSTIEGSVYVIDLRVISLIQIYQLSLKNKHCAEVHRLLPIECVCAFWDGSKPEGVKLRWEYYTLYYT